MYFDTLSCTACEIVNSFPLETLYNYRDSSDYELVVIYAPKLGEFELTIDILQEKRLNYKAYVDSSFIYENSNPEIRNCELLHFCMVNDERKPIVFGNPLLSDEVWERYVDIICSN